MREIRCGTSPRSSARRLQPLPLMYDFDITGMVTGPHNWFPRVFNEGFLASRSRAEIQAMAQVQRTRSLFSRAELNAARQHFMAKKAAIDTALGEAALDPDSRAIIKSYIDGFFRAIETDAAFYRPVVTAPNVMAYLDAGRTKPACDVPIAVGNPVAEPVRNTGDRWSARTCWMRSGNGTRTSDCDAARAGPGLAGRQLDQRGLSETVARLSGLPDPCVTSRSASDILKAAL